MRNLIALGVVVVTLGFSPTARAQLSPEEAKSKLAERDAQRQAERQQIIGRYQTYREQSGTQRDSLGGSHPVYENIERQDGRIGVTLIDGVVTAVDAR